MYTGLTRVELDDSNCIWQGALPAELVPDDELFRRLWDLHPGIFHTVKILGKTVKTPR